MKLGFDAKRAFLNRTGLGNYSRWLIDALQKHYADNEYFLYTPGTNLKIYDPEITPKLVVRTPAPSVVKSWWRRKGIVTDLKRDHVDIYHGLSHELPIGVNNGGIKTVVTIHDVIVLRFPEYFKLLDRLIYKNKLKHACKVADRIVAISEQTKRDTVELLGVNPARIEVIYQSCDDAFGIKATPEQITEAQATHQLPTKYLLTVGTIEERKNLLLIAKALKQVKDIPLVVIGKPTPYLEVVKAYLQQNKLSDRVIFLHQVPFAHLPAIYQQAACLIYPSRYEGFGIPVLEAITSGVPVIAATGSCLEEAGGPDSLYVSPDNHSDLAEKINLVLNDETLREKMIAKGLAYSRNFDDRKLAAQYMALYQKLLNHA